MNFFLIKKIHIKAQSVGCSLQEGVLTQAKNGDELLL
jgi:hypothetical protein